MSNFPWKYMAPNPTNTSPQFPNNPTMQFYGAYPWHSTGTVNGTGSGIGVGTEAGGSSTIYPYLSTGSGILPYSHFPYVYPPIAPYRAFYRPQLGSGSSQTVSGGETSDEGIAGVAGGPSSGSGDAQTEALIKREEEPASMSTLGVDQSRLEGSPCASAGGGDAPGYKKPLPVRFSGLDLKELSPNQVVFYYGVLAAQAVLLPRFEFTQGQINQKWGGTLTMYGHTLVEPAIFKTQNDAKVELCQAALKKLVAQFSEWSVPDEPGDVLAQKSNGRDWVKTLHDHCVQKGLREPKYTAYKVSNSHWRHKVQLEGGSFFGFLKTYPDEWESKNATAHMGLHSILVNGNGVSHGFLGPSCLKRSDESLLACVPRAPSEVGTVSDGTSRIAPGKSSKRKAEDGEMSGDNHRSPKRRRTQSKNANLLPVIGSKIPSVSIKAPKEEKKWKITPGELQDQLKGFSSQSDRLEKACALLSLHFPEIRINRLDGRLVETNGEYTAAAYFQGDPFLTRAGAIGTFSGTKPSKSAAREACAGNVVTYLVKIVNEDTVLEEMAASQRAGLDQWRENIEKVYEENGWLE